MKKKKSPSRKKNTKATTKQIKSKQPQSLVQFFAQSPLAGVNLDLERIPDYGREIEL